MKRIKVCIIALLVVSLFSACKSEQSENSNDGFAEQYKDYGGEMLVLGVVNDSEPTENGVVYLDSLSDNLNIQFANLTETDSEYIIKVFFDYEETEFSIDGVDVSEYVFQAKAGESLTFPITINPDAEFDSSHILTVAVLTAPNKYAAEIDLMSNSYGMVLSYELAKRGQERSIEEKTIAEEPEGYIPLNFQGLMLNSDFKFAEGTSVKFPAKELTVKANEMVSMAYRAGNYEKSEDILLLLLVDWKQADIDGSPFLHIANKEGSISYGTLEFQAPSEPGKYEVTAFVVDSPYSMKVGDTFHTHDTSYRFTLVVE